VEFWRIRNEHGLWFPGFRLIKIGGKDALAEKTTLCTGGPGSGVYAAAVPQGRRQTSTCIVGMRQNGLVAPYIFEDAIDGRLLHACVDHVLDPPLRAGDKPIF